MAGWTATSPPSAASSRASTSRRRRSSASTTTSAAVSPTRSPAPARSLWCRSRPRRARAAASMSRKAGSSTTWRAPPSACSSCAAPRASPAGTTGRTPPRPTPQRARSASTHPPSFRASPASPASPTARSWSPPSTASPMSTTRRRPTPTPPPRLPDRHGDRELRGDAGGPRAPEPLRRARARRRRGARRGARPAQAGRGGAAVAGLRLLRPVRQFRGARRCLPPPRRGAAGSARMSFARTDQSAVAQWWWTVDRWTLAALAMLIGFGALLVMAASPMVAARIHAGGPGHVDTLFFAKRYFAVLPAAIAAMFAVSLQSPRRVRRIALAGFVASLALLAYTLVGGVEIKGARRWIALPGLSLQPSEFVKPTFAVVSAWLFAQYRLRERFPGQWIAIALYALVVGLLIKQPDLGMAAVVSAVWLTQFFLAGLRLVWVALGMATGIAGLVGAYFALPHVASRIDRFLDPASGDSYQVDRSMDAFMNGGWWG